MKHVVGLALALILAIMGQRQFDQGRLVRDALLLYGAAAVVYILAVRNREAEVAERQPPPAMERASIPRLAIVAVGVILAGFGMSRFYTSASSNMGLAFWLAGMLLTGLGFAIGRPRVSPDFFRVHRQEAIVFVLLMLVALFMRVYHLGQFPAGAYLDEADNGLEALKLGDSPYYIPYTRASNGHPTLFLYLLSFGFKLFGEGVLAMRLVTVLIGLGTVAAFYFLVREWLGVRPAQFATFALAVSRWHVNFSRVVFEGVLTPFFIVLTLLFLFRALRTGRWREYVWAGLALGLGLQGYIAYRVFPLIVLLYLLLELAFTRGFLRSCWKGLLVFGVSAIIGFGPLALYFLRFPEDFMHRAKQASVMQDIEREGSYKPLQENIKKTALMFNQSGDPRPRHNLPHAPMLDPWSGMFFLLGLGYALYRSREPKYAILWIWLPIGALPGVLSLADSNPHSLRTIVNLPAVFLLVAAFWKPAVELVRRTFRRWGRQPLLAVGIVMVLLSGWSNFDVYFHKQANHQSVYYDFDPWQNQAAQFALAHSKTHRLLISPALTNHSAIKFIDYRVPYEDFLLNQHLPLRDVGPKDVMYVLEIAHGTVVQRLQELYPAGILQSHLDRYGQLAFYSYEVAREDMVAIQGLQGSYYAGSEIAGAPAFQRRDPTLDFDWDMPPISAPFAVRWKGSLYVPVYGDYTLVLETRGGLGELTLDDEPVVKIARGKAQKVKRLPAGFHPIQVEFRGEEAPAGLKLRWIVPGASDEQVIAQENFYDEGLSRFGLLGRYFRGADNFSGAPALVQIDAYIAPNDPLPAPFSIEWLGKIYAPRSGRYVFGTNSDDGSFLFINGQMVVDNGGHHGDVYREGSIELQEGFHELMLRYFQVDGGRKIELWWIPPGGTKEQVPAAYLLPPGASEEILPPPAQVPPPPPPVQTPAGEELPPLPGATLVAAWGSEGSAEGQFREPRGVAIGPQGRVYVADSKNKRVQCFQTDGTFIRAWSEAGEPMMEPFDIAVDRQGRVYVLDVGRQVVARYSADGQFQGEIGANLGLYGPRGLGLDAEGNIYIADTGGSRILKVSSDGQILAILAKSGKGHGQVDQPTDVAVDLLGRLYIADTLNNRLQVLDASGGYLGEWPLSGANTTDGPHVDVSPAGYVLVTDPEAHKVLVFDGRGNLVGEWGGEGVAPGQFRKTMGVGIGPGGLVAVSDVYNHRVQVFSIGEHGQ